MKAGDKVVCVDDKFPPHLAVRYRSLPLKGRVYVVRETRIEVGEVRNGELALLLAGIHNPKHPKFGIERGFYATRFRKLEDLKAEASRRQQKEQPAPAKP